MIHDSGNSRAVLVTGGAVRLGQAIALHLARAGWHIAIHYRHSAEEAASSVEALKACNIQAVAVQGDLRDEADLSTLIRKTSNGLGMPLTALVNNAAAFNKDNIATFSRDSWLGHMDTNLYAPLKLIADFASQLPVNAQGAVVNLIDGCEDMCLSPTFLTYSLSKYGLAEATRLLAQDLAPRIRVNGVSPGLTLPKEGEEEMFRRLVAKTPLKRPSPPSEIAKAVCYLLESKSITGQILAVNGGAGLK